MNIFSDMENDGNPRKTKKDKEKPCRACYDFKSWATLQQDEHGKNKMSTSAENPHPSANCPLDKDELGKNTWSFLHTMAAYFPRSPSERQQKEMSVFIKLFSKYYPCDHCAQDFRKSIRESPPETQNRNALSMWLCKMHNEVNRKLGKEEFDCNLVDQRWKDGWDDGSCG